MASPAYANDLTTVATGDLNFDAGVWEESGDAGWDTAGGAVDDEDLWYVDTIVNTGEAASSCTANQYTKPGTGSGATGPGTMIYVHTAAFTVPTDGIVSIDNYWAAPPSLNLYAGTHLTAEAGVSVLIATDHDNFDVHYVAGRDKFPATDGVYTTYFVDPTLTPAGTVGTTTTINGVGIAIAATEQARGNPNAVQSVRYGRAEVEYTLGDATTPANFDGYAVIDNALSDKFNLLQYVEGALKARGLMSFGTAATAVYFEDSDKSIVIADDLKVGTAFNKGVVLNSSSELYWNNISIKNLGTVAKYTFSNPDNAITEHNGGVFEDVGIYTYNTNSTNTGVTYRRQEIVNQNGGTFNTCTFDAPVGVSALVADSLGLVDECIFNSSGSNYGTDVGNITTTLALDWKNKESLHVTGTAGTDVGVTPTGNETILCNVSAGEVLTINVATGASTPSVANSGTGTVDVVAGLLPLTINVKDSSTGLGIPDARVMVQRDDTKATIISGNTNASGVYSESVAASYDTVDYVGWVRQMDLVGTDYTPKDISGTISSTGFDITIVLDPI